MMVYVDDMYKYAIGAFRGMRMSHMAADTTEELVRMAEKIGLNPSWIQHSGTWREHFDVSEGKRALAIANGAAEKSMRELVVFMKSKPTN